MATQDLKQASKQTPNGQKKQVNGPILTGVKVRFFYNDEGHFVYRVKSKMKRKSRYQYPDYVAHLLEMLAAEVGQYTDELVVFSEMDFPCGQIYQASPFFQGKPWYDWAKMQVAQYQLSEKVEVLFSPVYEKLQPATLAQWILDDRLEVRMQVQLHKVLWGEKQGV